MSTKTNAPIELTVREREFDLQQVLGHDWNANDAVLTALFDSLSVMFPPGEAFFIASVKAHMPQLADGALAAQARAFCKQEGGHSREHARYNEALEASRGYSIAQMQRAMRDRIARSMRELSPIQRLAATVA